MESMRSLNRSLPSTPPNRPAPPEQLLQAFRQAALSVTNLYKSAASDHDSIRQAGYQDAIDDLLKFLDRENLGVQDGEGWRVRQWATTKYDGTYAHPGEEEDEDTSEAEQRNRSNSPEKTAEHDEPAQVQHQRDQEHVSPIPAQDLSKPVAQHQQQSVFQFSAGNDHTMQTDEAGPSSSQGNTPPVRIEVVNRTNRNSHKHNNRHTPRAASRTTTQTAGSKRKLPFPDMSEIFNIGFDKKDNFDGGSGGGGGGGGKRSRLV